MWTIIRTQHRRCFSSSTFEMLGLGGIWTERLAKLGLQEPTQIQKRAIPPLLRRESDTTLVGAQTGSGKTLAYLLPVLHALERDETKQMAALVLTPNYELAHQVGQEARRLNVDGVAVNVVDSHTIGTVSGSNMGSLIITTPRMFCQKVNFVGRNPLASDVLRRIGHVIVDECDSVWSDGSGQATGLQDILLARKRLHRLGHIDAMRLILVGATFPNNATKSFVQVIRKEYPHAKWITCGGSMHRSLPNIDQTFTKVECSAASDLADRFVRILEQDPRALAFVNTSSMAEEVHMLLPEAWKRRVGRVCKTIEPSERAKLIERFRTGQLQALISTDLASRGLDIPNLEHVVQLQFALSSVDYLHRCGRVGRMGKVGRVTSFYDISGEKLVRHIETAVMNEENLQETFSRRRGFRRKMKREAASKASNDGNP